MLQSPGAATIGAILKELFIKISKNLQKKSYVGVVFNKVAGFSPAALLKKRLQLRCFPVNFAKFKNIFFTEHSGQLLLKVNKIIIFFMEEDL